jgi:threonine/homoserine/homoserine lactone efflux protein
MNELMSFALAALALAGSPGPATLSLAATGAAFGLRPGLRYLSGIVAGMMAVIGLVASGIVGLVLLLPAATVVLTLLAGAYFLYLAYVIATAPPLTAKQAQHPPRFADGVLLSLVNPKGYAAMAALFSGFVIVGSAPSWAVGAKIALLIAIIVAVNVAWLVAGQGLTRFLRDPRTSRLVNLALAALLIASLAFAFLF